jgi:3-oxoacyl-[acyl-carrier-protein] synthase II
MPICITGISSVSGLGNSLAAHQAMLDGGHSALRPLREFPSLKMDTGEIKGAWIEPRELTLSRKWAPASCLSVLVAKVAVEDAKLTKTEVRNAAVIAGSSRGNAWLNDWPNRRPFKLMAASNSMHGEIASAVTIELGITGPWQVVSSGCSASLDAIGLAFMMLRCGIVKHAIVIGVELPIVPAVIQSYLDTGVLSHSAINDPYSPDTSGFHPGESASALILESCVEKIGPEVLGYWCNSDAVSPIGMPEDGNGLRQCLMKAKEALKSEAPISAICPHASGTWLHAKAEQQALLDVFGSKNPISLHVLKPFTGHTVGASGLLDTAILAHYLREKNLPPNLPNLTSPPPPFTLPSTPTACSGNLVKIAVGMGGHNSVIALKP